MSVDEHQQPDVRLKHWCHLGHMVVSSEGMSMSPVYAARSRPQCQQVQCDS